MHTCAVQKYCNPAGIVTKSTDSATSVCIDQTKVLSEDQKATEAEPICKDASGKFFKCDAGKICTPGGSKKEEVCATGTTRNIFWFDILQGLRFCEK